MDLSRLPRLTCPLNRAAAIIEAPKIVGAPTPSVAGKHELKMICSSCSSTYSTGARICDARRATRDSNRAKNEAAINSQQNRP